MPTLLKQFFDKNTLFGLGAILLVHLAAFATQHTSWSILPWIIIVLATFIVTQRSLVWGLAFAFLEIFVGGHGHLIDASIGGATFGIRQGIFLAVMLGALYHLFIKKVRPVFVTERDLPFVFLGLAIILGSITGFTRNAFGAAFDDMNSYATLAYLLPMSMILWTQEAKRVLLWTFALSATWVAGSSLILLFAFTHLDVHGIWTLYGFVRDARIAEVTLLSGPSWLVGLLPTGPWYFRVFEQGQFTVMMFTLLLCGALVFLPSFAQAKRLLNLPFILILALMFAVDIASQSRSFWLGLFVSACVLGCFVFPEKMGLKDIGRMKLAGSLSILVALIAIWALVVTPVPSRPDLTKSEYYKGQNDDTRDLAVSSRWNLLGPMMTAIGHDPLWGSGFGTTVTFMSDDPRLKALNGTGEWTTYRFEWGYQDIWLKMGVPGLLAFLFFLITILRAGFRSFTQKEETRWITISLSCGIIALFVVHITSPYLNHPLGIGFMVFVLPFFSWKQNEPVMDSVRASIPHVPRIPVRQTAAVRKLN